MGVGAVLRVSEGGNGGGVSALASLLRVSESEDKLGLDLAERSDGRGTPFSPNRGDGDNLGDLEGGYSDSVELGPGECVTDAANALS